MLMTNPTVAQIPALLNKLGTKRFVVPVVIFVAYLIVSWTMVGTLFGGYGLTSGDDWYTLSDSALGHLPACTAVVNFIGTWRPFQPTYDCVLYSIVGPNLSVFFVFNALCFAVTAFAWYGIIKNIFNLPDWFAFIIGLIALTYPDQVFRLGMIRAADLLGETLIFFGIWIVLIYIDRRSGIWRLVVGCVLALFALLTYESALAVWAVGLPLAALYKSGRITRHWLLVTFSTELTAVGYLLWRFLILPTTYNDKTFIVGAYEIKLTVTTFLGQLRDSFLLVVNTWAWNIRFLVNWRGAYGTAHDLPIILISLGVGVIVLLMLFVAYRLEPNRPILREPSHRRGRDLLIAGCILIVLMGLPFYITPLNLLVDKDHTFGTPLGVSLGIVGIILLLLRGGRLVLVISLAAICIVVFNSIFTGYRTADTQGLASNACDFFLRFTDVVERLPQNVYVIITAPRDRVVADYFGDAYQISSYLALLYFEGPHEPSSYSYGHFGDSGYMIFPDSWSELTPDGVKVFWPPWVTEVLHSREPLPDLAPLDHTIYIRYDPYRSLTILSAPENLEGLVVHPEGGARSRASALERHFCDWDTRARDTIQQLDQASQEQAPADVFCYDEGLTVYKLDSTGRSKAIQLSKEELNQFPQHPATNTQLAQGQDIRLYRLTSGELQINAPPISADAGEYVYRWDGCSR